MPSITFDNVTKSFGKTQVIRDFSVRVDDGEFLVLLGPSGCGKSTLLRMVAGLTDVTSGIISFDDEVVNNWDVRRRNAAFVFQSYALYPQMTVRKNIAFPLIMDRFHGWHHLPLVSTIVRRRLMQTSAIREKINSIANELGLIDLLDRRPANLSGGQRQRVALARALVRAPALYLLDEPLSNLDAKLRTQMRSDIVRLHRSVGKTFIYVTHDQVEAMTMATNIVVMNDGVIQQVGTPDDIYDRPNNTFVATFVGAPPMNLIDARVLRAHPAAIMGGEPLSDGFVSQVIVGIRPEDLRIESTSDDGVPVEIEVIERIGSETLIGCRLVDSSEGSAETSLVFARIQRVHSLRTGVLCCLRADAASLSWFARSTGERVDDPAEWKKLMHSS